MDPETGLYYYRARYYSPKLGRFLQTDPIGTKDDLNLYAYVYNDSIDRTDPSGTASIFNAGTADTSGVSITAEDLSDLALDSAPVTGEVRAVSNFIDNPTVLNGVVVAASLVDLGGLAKGLSKAAQLAKNVVQGAKAEAKVAAKLGDQVAGKQVTFRTSDGTRTRADIVTKDRGVVEVKSGDATLTKGQQKLQDDIRAGRQVTPVGQNARDAGLTPGQPTRMTSCNVEQVRCP